MKFVAHSLSHTIYFSRTPLNCILGISNLLLEGGEKEKLNPEITESIQMISSSGDLLLAVVNDVLDFSKLSHGKIELSKTSASLQQIVKMVTETLKVKAESNDLDLIYDIADDVPLFLHTDPRRLQQILYNLIGSKLRQN